MSKQLYLDKIEERKKIMEPYILRPYQQRAVDICMKNEKEIHLDLCMGGGKSLIISELARLNNASCKVVVLTNISALIDQLEHHLKLMNIEPNIIKAGKHKKTGSNTYLIMEQSFHDNKREDFADLKNCILLRDEIHVGYHGKRYKEIITFLEPQRVIGFSGTPYDEIGCMLNKNIIPYTILTPRQATEKGWLTPLKWYIPNIVRNIDRTKLKTSGNDYSQASISEVMMTKEFGKAYADFCEKIDLVHSHTLVFCSNIEQAEWIRDIMIKIEPTTEMVHSKLKTEDNELIINSFKEGFCKVLVSVSSLNIGFDAPIADTLINLRPTKVRRLANQFIFRVARLHEDKPFAKIYDIGGVINEFGFIDKEDYIPQETKEDAKAITKENQIDEIESIIEFKNEEILAVSRDKIDIIIKEIEKYKQQAKRGLGIPELMKAYEASFSFEDILDFGSLIYKAIYQTEVKLSTRDWILNKIYETVEIVPKKETYFKKAIKTRYKNIIKQGKKPASLFYFCDFLLDNLKVNGPWLFQEAQKEQEDDFDSEIPF